MEALADHVGQLVGILANGGDADGARPVVVQVTHLVRHHLNLVGGEISSVLHRKYFSNLNA